jgi:hypothetical protein
VSLKVGPIGKPSTPNGNNLTYDWRAVEISQKALLFEHNAAGKPCAPGQFKKGHRRKTNFLRSNVLILDFDGPGGQGLSDEAWAALAQYPFTQEYAFGMTESFSSRPGARKGRLWFQLDQAITNPDEYRALMVALMSGPYPEADPAAKDAARAFYGPKPGTLPYLFQEGTILPLEVLQSLQAQQQQSTKKAAEQRAKKIAQQQQRPTQPGRGPFNEPTRDEIEFALSCIPGQNLAYGQWLNVLMALSTLPYGLELAQEWTDDPRGVGLESRFQSFRPGSSGAIGLGTLFFVAKQYGYRPAHRRVARPEPPHPTGQASPKRITRVNGRYLNEVLTELPPDALIAIQSGIGTGKTEWVCQQLQGKKSIWVTHRITLADNSLKRLSKAGLVVYHYNDPAQLKDWQTAEEGVLVIVLNSLPKIQSLPGRLLALTNGLVVIDESEQVAAHLTQGNLKPKDIPNTYRVLRSLIANNRVICLDAHLGPLTAQLLQADFHLIINEYVPPKRKITLYDNANYVLFLALEAAKKGEKIAIAFDSKRATQVSQAAFEQLGVWGFPLTGDTSQTAYGRAYIAELDEHIKSGRVTLYNSALGSGFDIQEPIQKLFVITMGGIITAHEELQLIGRFRHVEEIIGYVAPRLGDAPEDWQAIKENYLDKGKTLMARGYAPYWDNNGKLALEALQEQLLDLECLTEAERNKQLNRHLEAFLEIAGTVYDIEQKEAPTETGKVVTTAIKEAKQVLAEEEWERVQSSEAIHPDVQATAAMAGQDSPRLQAGVLRWNIEDTYQAELNKALFMDFKQGKGMALRRMCIYLSPSSEWLAHDAWEYKQAIPIAKLSHQTGIFGGITAILNDYFPEGFTSERISRAELITRIQDIHLKLELYGLWKGLGWRYRGESKIALLRKLLAYIGLGLERGKTRQEVFYQVTGLERFFLAHHRLKMLLENSPNGEKYRAAFEECSRICQLITKKDGEIWNTHAQQMLAGLLASPPQSPSDPSGPPPAGKKNKRKGKHVPEFAN